MHLLSATQRWASSSPAYSSAQPHCMHPAILPHYCTMHTSSHLPPDPTPHPTSPHPPVRRAPRPPRPHCSRPHPRRASPAGTRAGSTAAAAPPSTGWWCDSGASAPRHRPPLRTLRPPVGLRELRTRGAGGNDGILSCVTTAGGRVIEKWMRQMSRWDLNRSKAADGCTAAWACTCASGMTTSGAAAFHAAAAAVT